MTGIDICTPRVVFYVYVPLCLYSIHIDRRCRRRSRILTAPETYCFVINGSSLGLTTRLRVQPRGDLRLLTRKSCSPLPGLKLYVTRHLYYCKNIISSRGHILCLWLTSRLGVPLEIQTVWQPGFVQEDGSSKLDN